ncbi:DUF2024 family protein [Chryseobacterium wangxinyae]|uniref:DUF2024 family protein n=1 Tax=Chryseobacterium sp. CY350 TaxID=2997336 RepID=UPI0022700AF0|nr:DUF2024 family protein [Chryseobacterium sp. CY350]MCY0977190.1 DUF2024 family protein [Chryseobacterium sp. CY350]WBZ95789.1 DUF2024 family protein [Chryseobacterium sp. CY350]
MKIAVWDTYVTKNDGTIMHFDILVPTEITDTEKIYSYGREYLEKQNQSGQPLSSKECNLCHVEEATSTMKADVELQGYHIIEIQNCD